MKKRYGKIIVIDGVDGVGKKTQTHLLSKRLKKMKKKVVSFDFPQYTQNFFGRNLKQFLKDPKYKFHEAHAKVFSIVLAADRWETKQKIEKYLSKGYIVIMDRYTSSNQIHQGGKIKDEKEWGEFVKWVEELEFKVFKIPRPDIIVYLSLNIQTVQKLLEERGDSDIPEKDIQHQRDAQISADRLAKINKKFKVIDCNSLSGGIKTKEEISETVFQQVKKFL